MPDYYIRTPEQEESRGPFDVSKLQTLADAGQVTPNTLIYDEDKEEWVPIALSEEIRALIFPEKEKLILKIKAEEAKKEKEAKKSAKGKSKDDASDLNVEAMLVAAEGGTQQKQKLKKQRESLERAASIAATGLGVMMILSALVLILPMVAPIQGAMNEGALVQVLNFPVILISIFDIVLGILLLLSVTEIYPIVRGRAMLTLGFGVYVGYAIGDPLVMILTAAAGIGLFLATISRSVGSLMCAFLLGIGGNGYLAYLASVGRFDNFFKTIVFNIVGS